MKKKCVIKNKNKNKNIMYLIYINLYIYQINLTKLQLCGSFVKPTLPEAKEPKHTPKCTQIDTTGV